MLIKDKLVMKVLHEGVCDEEKSTFEMFRYVYIYICIYVYVRGRKTEKPRKKRVLFRLLLVYLL